MKEMKYLIDLYDYILRTNCEIHFNDETIEGTINSYQSNLLTFTEKLELMHRIKRRSTSAAASLFHVIHPTTRTWIEYYNDLYKWIGPYIKLRIMYGHKAVSGGIIDGDLISPIEVERKLLKEYYYKSIKVPDKDYYGKLLNYFIFNIDQYKFSSDRFTQNHFYNVIDKLIYDTLRRGIKYDKVKVK